MNSASAAVQQPTVVIVHGTCADAAPPWRKIVPLLQAQDLKAGAIVILHPRAHVAHSSDAMRAQSSAKICTLAPWQERRAKALLESNITGRITLTDLASACELSVRHFTRAFRGSTGTSPHAWLLRLRLEKAQKLLENVGNDLVDIAMECGFADQSHLTRAFRRSFGMSPGAWRRLHRR